MRKARADMLKCAVIFLLLPLLANQMEHIAAPEAVIVVDAI